MTKKTGIDDRRRVMFQAALHAVAEVWPDQAGTYCCPLCGEFFRQNQIDALSVDHAPPYSLRGRRRVTVLTCRRCNNRAGQSVDDAMLDHEELRDMRLHRMTRARKSVIQSAKGPIVMEVQFGAEGALLFGVPQANRMETHDAWVREMETLIARGELRISGAISSRRPRHWAKVGWLRSAYLIAFASCGYRYIFSPALKEVRTQLDPANRQRIVIDNFLWRLEGVERSQAAVYDIHEPEPLRSIAVQMGDAFVFLPVQGNMQLYSRLADESTDLRNLRYLPVPWPVPPTYGKGPANQTRATSIS